MTPSGWPATWSARAHDPGEQGRRLARATGRVPTGSLAREALVGVDCTVARRAHGDVRHPSVRPDDLGHPVLVGRTLEDDRLAPTTGQGLGPELPAMY